MTRPTDDPILPHGPIELLADNLWRVVGDLPNMPLKRHMIVARADDGRLLLHNGIWMEPAAMAELEALGRPTWLVVPSGFHRLDAPRYKAAYPEIEVLCPRGARRRVAQKVPVDGTYDEAGVPDGLELIHLRGLKGIEGVLRVRSPDGVSLVFNDALFNQPHLPGLFGWIYRMLGSTGRPKVTLIGRLVLVKDKRAYADHLRELASDPELVRVIPGHIEPITQDAPAALRAVADELAPA